MLLCSPAPPQSCQICRSRTGRTTPSGVPLSSACCSACQGSLSQTQPRRDPTAVRSGGVKELALLTHLVKLRRSCQEMILPDIRKCSKSDQIMGANRYLCCKSLGAIRQSLWPKNSHNMAIFPYFLTSLVTFLVVRTTFMHLSSTERTQTLLTHVG